MFWHSVRFRLTLWNVVVLALVLSGFGAALCYAVQANQSAAIDRALRGRVRREWRRPPQFGGPGARGFVGGRFFEVRSVLVGPPAPEDLQRMRNPFGRPGMGGPPREWRGDRGDRPRFDQGPEGPRGPERNPSFGGPGNPRRDDRRGGPGGPDGPGGPREPGRPFNVRRGEVPWFGGENDELRNFRRELLFDGNGKPPSIFPNDTPWDPAALKEVLRTQKDVYSTVTADGERIRVLTVRTFMDDQPFGVCQAAHPLAEQQRLVDSQFRTLLILLPLAVLVAGLGGLFLTNRALLPVQKVTTAAAQIGAEDLSRRLEVTGKDELAQLALTFNGMISRLESAFKNLGAAHRELETTHTDLESAYRKLEQAFEQQRRFTGDASHELRTPLTRIKGSTSLALCGPHDADSYHEALVIADEAADHMARIVQDLLLLARSDAGQLPVRSRTLSLGEILHRAVTGLREEAGADVRVEVALDAPQVSGDPDHLARLFVNLVENALRHTPTDGQVTLTANSYDGMARVTVADTGEGIPADHLPHVCERFYRVDAARTGGRGGTGLGLAICQSIVEAHGGQLTIESQVGHGTTVTVTLPAASVPALTAVQAVPALMA